MPIQIKIKSSGADISEYDAPVQKQEPQITSENAPKKEKDNTEAKNDITSDAKDTSENKSDKVDDSTDIEQTEKSGESSNADGAPEGGPEGGVNYEYEGDDVYYTDPSTKVRYCWDKEANSWVSQDGKTAVPPSQPSSENYIFDGETYFYRDESGTKHKWNQASNQWEQQEDSSESEEDDNTTEEQRKARQYRKRKAAPGWENKKYEKDPVSGKTIYKDPLDNMTYEWDEEKKAWFPQIGEDFMAAYQLNYGFTNDLESKPTVPEPPSIPDLDSAPGPSENKQPKEDKKLQKGNKIKKEAEPPKWFEEEDGKSTKVYVSGLPDTITEKQLEEIMSKCGMVEHDVRTKKAKLKIYKDEKGVPKGDGLCTYIKHESVELALQIIDGSQFQGKTLKVERAKFEMKGDAYDPKLKPKKLNKKEKEKAAKQKEKLFAWIPDKMKGERGKNEKVIIIKNLFDPLEFSVDPTKILDYSARIRTQCSKFGTITKLVLFDKHEEGICQISFTEASEADLAIEMLHGRLFGKRVMNVTQWDGRTKYKKETEETKEEEAERLSAWEKYLEGEQDQSDKEKKSAEEPSKESSNKPTDTNPSDETEMVVDNTENDQAENSESVEMKDEDNQSCNGSTESNGN